MTFTLLLDPCCHLDCHTTQHETPFGCLKIAATKGTIELMQNNNNTKIPPLCYQYTSMSSFRVLVISFKCGIARYISSNASKDWKLPLQLGDIEGLIFERCIRSRQDESFSDCSHPLEYFVSEGPCSSTRPSSQLTKESHHIGFFT